LIAKDNDIFARFQGGNNTGHTVEIEDAGGLSVSHEKSNHYQWCTKISLTKLDVLTGIDPIRICVGYYYGEKVDYLLESQMTY